MPKNLYDLILKQQHRVEARANALADEMLAALEGARESLTSQLTSLQVRFLTARAWEEESLTRKKAFLEAQRQEVNRIISEVYESKAPAVLSAAQDTMAYVQSETASHSLANRINFELGSPRLDLATVQAWTEATTVEGLTINEWLTRMAGHTADKIVQAGREAIIQGMTVQKTAQLLRQRGIEGTQPQVESLARTYLLSASNYAREQSVEALGVDLDFQWLYVATLDGRTCLVCGADDGRIFKKTDKRPSLPRHINCRCVYVPVFGSGTLTSVNRAAVKHSGHTVHHRDGSTSTKYSVESVDHVPAQESYAEWINRQVAEDPVFAREVLGKTRFDLLRKGEITLKRMVVDGRIRKLSDL